MVLQQRDDRHAMVDVKSASFQLAGSFVGQRRRRRVASGQRNVTLEMPKVCGALRRKLRDHGIGDLLRFRIMAEREMQLSQFQGPRRFEWLDLSGPFQFLDGFLPISPINRGRGDAALTWGAESQPFDRFKAQALPPGAARSPDDWAPLVVLPGVPRESAAPATPSAARQYAAAAGQNAWRRTLAPRHQSAVKKYFEK